MRRTRYLRNLGYIHEPIEIPEPRIQLAVICLNYNFGLHWIRDHFIICDSTSNNTMFVSPNFDPMVEWEVTIVTEPHRLRGYRYTHFVLLQEEEIKELNKWEFFEGIHHLMYQKKPEISPTEQNHHLEFTDPDYQKMRAESRQLEYSRASQYKEFLEW